MRPRLLIALLSLVGSAQAFSADPSTLNIYNWADYIDPSVIDEFESEYGIEVNYDIHDYLALVPVIQGAGGVITDWDGRDLTIRSGDRFVAAGDRQIHAQALDILEGAKLPE